VTGDPSGHVKLPDSVCAALAALPAKHSSCVTVEHCLDRLLAGPIAQQLCKLLVRAPTHIVHADNHLHDMYMIRGALLVNHGDSMSTEECVTLNGGRLLQQHHALSDCADAIAACPEQLRRCC
jgi:hypothetical protein